MQRIKLLSLAITRGGAQHVDLRLLVELSVRSLGGALSSLVCSLFFYFLVVFFPH